MNDVLSISARGEVDLHVHAHDTPCVLRELLILSNDVIELNLHPWLDLTYSIYSAHDHLVKHSID